MACRELNALVKASRAASGDQRLYDLYVPHDFVRIQDALDHLPYGGAVSVAAGVYDERVVGHNGCTLVGAGAAATVLSLGCEATNVADAAVIGFTLENFQRSQAEDVQIALASDCSTIAGFCARKTMLKTLHDEASNAQAGSSSWVITVQLHNAAVHFENC